MYIYIEPTTAIIVVLMFTILIIWVNYSGYKKGVQESKNNF